MRRLYTAILLITLSFLCLYAGSKLFTTKLFTSHDGPGHVVRLLDFYDSLKDGQFPVRISKRLDNGLGYPYYNFNYPLIYYIGSIFIFLNTPAVVTFNLLFLLSIFIGAFSMYLFVRDYYGRKAGFISAVFYTFAPYRFLDIYVRGNLGESLALSVLPLFLYAINLIHRKNKNGPIVFIASLSFMIMIHNLTGMFAFGIGLLLYLFNTFILRQKKYLKTFLFSTFLSFGITAFFIIPIAIETRLTNMANLAATYKDFFPSLKEVIYSPWGFGLWEKGPFPGKMSPQLGLIHELVLGVTCLLIFVRLIGRRLNKDDYSVLLFIAISFGSLFLALPYSKFLWDNFFLLQLVSMSWRFIGFATLAISFMAGYLVFIPKRKGVMLMVILIPLVLYANRNHVSVNMYTKFEYPFNNDGVYGLSTAAFAEHRPKASSAPHKANYNGEIISATGSAVRTVWKSNYHKFSVNIAEDSYFRDDTYYFPGWEVAVDGKKKILEYRKDYLQRLYVFVPKGRHTIEFFFKETYYRLIADWISVLSLLIFAILIAKTYGKNSPCTK